MLIQQLLMAAASVLLAVGGATHLRAYPKALAAVAASNLAAFFGNALKALWLMDSAGMFVLAAVCAVLAYRPAAASGAVTILLGLVPLSTAGLLYVFIGNFFAAHILIATSAAIIAAGWLRT